MQVFVLRIDIPDEWFARPLRTHEGIFATHEIEIACPQQFVVVMLSQEGHDAHRQGAARHAGAGRCGLAQKCLHGIGRNAFRHQAEQRLAAVLPCRE